MNTTHGEGAVLLTGATGFVGMELLARYLERTERPVTVLVRANTEAAARTRIDAVLLNLFGGDGRSYADRVEPVPADLTSPRLGLSRTRYTNIARGVSTVVHGAASVSFTLPLQEARAVNVEGTRRMLELAEAAQVKRYAHVSTAYVAGTREGPFAECDLELGQGFRNTYEQTKFEAEQLVRSHPELPYTTLRPSIVVGDRRSGWTAAFNVLYWPLRAFARGLFTAVPGIPSAPLDVVPVDYVADAIYELSERGEERRTYHLTAGPHATTIGELASLASRYFRRPAPTVLPPAEFAALQRPALEGSLAYFPYFSVATVFENAATRARLQAAGIDSSPLRDYLERLLDFATRSRWGKRAIARVEAMAV